MGAGRRGAQASLNGKCKKENGKWIADSGHDMKRRLFNILAAVSLMVCVTMAVLWVRSYYISELFAWNWRQKSVFAETGGGQFRFEFTYVADPALSYQPPLGFQYHFDKVDGPLEEGMRMPGSEQHFRGLGFWIVSGERWGDMHYAIFMPAWFASVISTLLPMATLTRFVCGRKIPNVSVCLTCGYNLTGNVSGVCSECGTVVPHDTPRVNTTV
jgi:hypothetical protein